MNITTNIFHGDGVKRIVTLVPIAIKSKNFLIERGVISEGDFNLMVTKVPDHLLANVSELVHCGGARPHCRDVQGTLVRIVGGREQRQIVPNLFHDIGAAAEGSPAFGINDNIADIIAERLVQGRGFSVEYADFHE